MERLSSLLSSIKFAEGEAKIIPDGLSGIFSAGVREEALLKVLFSARTKLTGVQVLFFAPLFPFGPEVSLSAILAASVPKTGFGPSCTGAAKNFGEVF